ncbi:MAG: phage terminase large subunit family protein [Thermodesulfobacteriota bacterium]|nr:phage terminase large subunit family protein [Thermodesulfobacteriota bacterium]
MSKATKKDDDLLLEQLMAVDAWIWADYNHLTLPSGPYLTEGHEYTIDILQCDDKAQCAMKGAQMGFTLTYMLKVIHNLIYGKYSQGFMYLFPTIGTVRRFSQSRFTPLITDNKCINKYVAGTDNIELKRVGSSNLYFTGARSTAKIEGSKKSSAALKSEPVDGLGYDEYDEMDMEMTLLAKARLDHSLVKDEFYLSTPSIPGFGIDKKYQKSDQRVRMIPCKASSRSYKPVEQSSGLGVGHETCLELEFPDCLKYRSDGTVYRACKVCGAEIFPKDGKWVARKPDVKDLVGWWISQLNSVYVDPGSILESYHDPPNGNLTEVMNSKLGMAHIASENKLERNDIYSCCGRDPISVKHVGPCSMGVDVGNILHVTIGYKAGKDRYVIIKIVKVDNFNDLHDLGKLFGVKMCVIDSEPEAHKVREFGSGESYPVFGCKYNENQRGAASWDERGRMVQVNRTEILDATHDLMTIEGRCVIPRRCKEVEDYAIEMCNTAKTLEEDPNTGASKYYYRVLGPDHYRHSTNYFYLACQKTRIFRPGEKQAGLKQEPNNWVW